MQDSMLLKTDAGRTVGYLLTQGEELRVRMDGTEERRLRIRYTDGSSEERTISCGRESRFARKGKTLQSAVVLEEDRVVAATEKALFREKTKREIRKAPERTESLRQKSVEKAEESLTQPECLNKQPERIWPQLRWPKPSCMPHAVYVQGKWTLPEES